MRTSLLLSTISAALALSIVTSVNPAIATTPPTPVTTTPAALPIPPPPPRVTLDANGQPMPLASAGASAGSTQIASRVTASPFAVLDRNKTGVVTREQANADPWLSTRFADCDADHDDQVTQSEYEACSSQRN